MPSPVKDVQRQSDSGHHIHYPCHHFSVEKEQWAFQFNSAKNIEAKKCTGEHALLMAKVCNSKNIILRAEN